MMLMPSDHTSLFSCAPSVYTSGAMYNEVPHVVFLFDPACSSFTAKPKSPTLTIPLSERKRLSGLISYA